MSPETNQSSDVSTPLDVVQFIALARGAGPDTSSLTKSPPPALKVLEGGELHRFMSDDGTLSTSTTLRTAEEAWFKDYCESLDLSSALSCPVSSPLESQRKTIKLPRPAVRRHRRNACAVPRLQSSPGGLPPLPPRRNPTDSPRSMPSLRKHASSWDFASDGIPSNTSFQQQCARPSHVRSNSLPFLSNPQDTAPWQLDTLAIQLEKLKQEHGKHNVRVAAVWNMIGNTHVRNGDHDAAILAYREAIKCERGVHLADSYGNMGTVMFKMGKVEESIVFFTNALSVHEYYVVSEGGDPRRSLKIANVQYQIGLAQTLMKHYEQAFSALKIACEIQAAVLGKRHADMAKTLDAVGKVYLLCSNYKAALACHKEALSIKKSLEVNNDVKLLAMLTTLQNIVSVHKACKDIDAAIFAYSAVLGTQKKLIEGGYLSITAEAVQTLLVLTDLFEERRMVKKAQSCLKEAGHLLEEAGYSPQSPVSIAVQQRLSRTS
ncbi:hypothetical protein ACA910_007766 [Epithemia clementina (nom. ined.)]